MLRWVLAIARSALRPTAVVALAGSVLSVAAPPPATAQDDKDQRYVFHEVDEGILRLDTQLGEISLCSRQSVGWACRTVPDERNALDAELARLQQENAELKSALVAQASRNGRQTEAGRDPLAKPDANISDAAKPEIQSQKPGTGDLARVRAVVGMIWNRLVEMMAALRADLHKEG